MEEKPPRRSRRYLPFVAVLAAIAAFLWFGSPDTPPEPLNTGSPTSTASPPATEAPPATVTPAPSATPALGGELPILTYEFPDGLIILSLQENDGAHLFLYHPLILPLTRITAGSQDDLDPALSPDGSEIAFTSNRDGSWDLYRLTLATGDVTRVTNSPAYEGSPDWSPDGQFLTYESLTETGLDIFITAADGSGDPIQLTDSPGADHSPRWSPAGRQVAFISNRSGEPEVWLADLQNTDERFTNLSRNVQAVERHPAWSADGRRIAWASVEGGVHNLYISNVAEGASGHFAGVGDWPVFSPDDGTLLTTIEAPNTRYLAAYPVAAPGNVSLPPLAVPGKVMGLDWGSIRLPRPLPVSFSAAAEITPEPLWAVETQEVDEVPAGRALLVPLDGVEAPDARLHDETDESFNALRSYTANELGWDLLGVLENAYVSITNPLPPGLLNDWLYTGRAFALTTSPVQAGWIVVVREDIGSQTYWRLYVRARFQDGRQGLPMKDLPFNLNARFEGDPAIYEQGGKEMDSLPDGYWIDFTEIALRFGWERLPALLNWRTFYQGARFNEFVQTGGLEWQAAMLELYPIEALITASPITPVTPTVTPSRTPTPTRTSSPTITPTPSTTPSPEPVGAP